MSESDTGDLNNPDLNHKDANIEVSQTEAAAPDTPKRSDEESTPEVVLREGQLGVVDEDDDTYDPENSGADQNADRNDGSESDAYDPEADVVEKEAETKVDTPAASNTLPPKPCLPAKPQITRQNTTNNESSSEASEFSKKQPQEQLDILREAYREIIKKETHVNPHFVNLTEKDQSRIVMAQLEEKGITLTTGTKFSEVPHINFDQVYSYNKPLKNFKVPIPPIPLNEFCRRPDIRSPMTPQDDANYNEFIKLEADLIREQKFDQFPDNSRLFIGNLPANTVSKQDLFRIYSKYGQVVQITIKTGYGFVQFSTMEECLSCIKGETNVPLHNKLLRLDASKRPRKGEGRDKRDRDAQDDGSSKRRRNGAECLILTNGKCSVFFTRKVKRAIQNVQVTLDVEDVTHSDVSEVISEAAYSGVLGTCIIKENKVDLQTFEGTSDGGIKFDEYSDIDPDTAADILQKAKIKKYGTSLPLVQTPSAGYGQMGTGGRYPDSYGSRGGRNRGNRKGDRRGNRNQHYQPPNGPYYNQYHQEFNGPNQYGSGSSYQSPYQSPVFQQAAYGNIPNYGQNALPYGSAPGQVMTPNSGIPPGPQMSTPGVPDQNQLLQTLQNMDPASMQNMLSLLQAKQQQQQQQQNYPVSGNNGGNNYGTNQSSNNQPANDSTSSSLMDTLARLSRK